MNCSVCNRPHHAKRLPFLCPVDARNRLYEGRVQLAQALIQNDEVERRVNAALSQPPPSDYSRAHMDFLKAQEEEAADRTSQIIAQAERLEKEIAAARKELEEKKAVLARRKSDLASVAAGSAARRSRQLDETMAAIQRVKYRWNRSADTMAATRAFLCEEAARLYGLRQIKKGNVKRYEIGGVEIFDVHAMNGLSPEVISTALAHIAHILVRATHYLAVRLPAEIILPHADYPRPTVFSLASSYNHDAVVFPGSALAAQAASSAVNGGTHLPRPRPLFVDKALPTLAKEDPAAYSSFMEGVALLAYDIAWLCCSQGVSIGDKESYEDICNMGQNLWRLLIGDHLHRRSVEPTFPSPLSGSPKEAGDHSEIAKPKSLMGRWSHGTTHSYLGGPEGTEFIREFKILAPFKISDRLKKRLSSEAPMLEWEKIEGDEIEDGFEDGVLVRGHGTSAGGRSHAADLGMASIMSVQTVDTRSGVSDAGTSRATSGWTKLKSR